MQHLSETPAYISLKFNTFVGMDIFLLNNILGFLLVCMLWHWLH